jgi:hypothetical protein
MARDRAEIQADISAVRALIHDDLDAAGARVRRRVQMAGALVGAAAVVGFVLSRTRFVPVVRSGLVAGVTVYRVLSVLASVGHWLDRHSQPYVDRLAARKHWPERQASFPRRAVLSRKGPSHQRVIVAATDLPLYHSLSAVFGDRNAVEVVLDRRRRNGTAWPASERRMRPEIDAEIRSTGWARVVLPLAP